MDYGSTFDFALHLLLPIYLGVPPGFGSRVVGQDAGPPEILEIHLLDLEMTEWSIGKRKQRSLDSLLFPSSHMTYGKDPVRNKIREMDTSE